MTEIEKIINNSPSLEELREGMNKAGENGYKHTHTKEEQQKLLLWWKKVYSSEKRGKILYSPQPTKTKIDYKEARKRLGTIAKRKASEKGKVFTLDTEVERFAWAETLKWLIFDKSSKIDVTKDIFITGLTGRGKSFLCECLVELSQWLVEVAHFSEKDFFSWKMIHIPDVHQQCQEKKSLSPLLKLVYGNFVFDEIGDEPNTVNLGYKQEYPFFEQIITRREKGRSTKRAIYTSNLTSNEVLSKIDSKRLDSRFKSLLGVEFVFEGKDKRL